MVIENGISRIGDFGDFPVVPIKAALISGAKAQPQPDSGGGRRIALVQEAGGVSVEKLLFSGEAAAIQSKAIEMIKAGRKLVLEGFPFEEIAGWCSKHNYHWRLRNNSS